MNSYIVNTFLTCFFVFTFSIILIVLTLVQNTVQVNQSYQDKNIDYREDDNNGQIIPAKVSVYTESKCPDCREFIIDQLYPVFQNYSQYIELDMIPFGKAQYKILPHKQYEFSCQHGPEECLGNRYEACATHLLQEDFPQVLMDYYYCMAVEKIDIQKAAEKCADLCELDFDRLQDCVDDERGDELLVMFGDRTQSLSGLRTVPTIVIDDEFHNDEQDYATNHFFKYLCSKLQGLKPIECSQDG